MSRLAATSLIWRMDYARDEGKSKPLAQHMSSGEFAIAALTALLPALVIGSGAWLPWSALLFGALGAAVATAWLAIQCARKLDGYTGDCLGAVQQLAEVAIYLGVLAALGRGAWG